MLAVILTNVCKFKKEFKGIKAGRTMKSAVHCYNGIN
jgi:hypothetical protein